MGPFISGDQEARRLAALRRYRVLDTPQEAAFDRITRMIARLCEAPVAVISFVDTDRQFLKSRFGLDISQTPSRVQFCRYAILSDEVMVIPDATADERFGLGPVAVGNVDVRF